MPTDMDNTITSLSPDKSVVCFTDESDGNFGKCSIGIKTSGNVLVFGDKFTFLNADRPDETSVSKLNENKFLVTYEDK